MLVKFKRNYTVKICDENSIQSGEFTFVEGKSYECEFKKNKLVIWDFDKAIFVNFNKKQIKEYLEDVL